MQYNYPTFIQSNMHAFKKNITGRLLTSHIENSEQEVSSQGSQNSNQNVYILQFLENQNKGILNFIDM